MELFILYLTHVSIQNKKQEEKTMKLSEKLSNLSTASRRRNVIQLNFKDTIRHLYVTFKAYRAAARGEYAVTFPCDPYKHFIIVELSPSLEKALSRDGFSFEYTWAGGKKYLMYIHWT